MPDLKKIASIIREYGAVWVFNRALYSARLKLMSAAPFTERWFEKKAPYPSRLDLFTLKVGELQSFIRALPERDKEELIKTADGACEGKINGFSSILLDYGNPIDWQLNPLTGKRCDERAKWYKIPDFDPERGDIKVTWEASRFSHFVTLARAYLLTGDEKYYQAFSNQLACWLSANHYARGANFKCSQECSLRLINALLAYAVFEGCGEATDGDRANMLDLVDRCYRKILANFFYSYRCIKNNHTVSELMGTVAGAWCCGDEKRLCKAYKRLDAVIDEQFTADGGYAQFSFNYQRLALQDLECVLSLTKKTGRSLSQGSVAKLKNAALLMYQCMDDCGDVPNYGNNDGALVFPVTSCSYRDFRPIVNNLCALTSGRRLFESGVYDEESLWFAPSGDCPAQAPKRVSSSFADAGLFTLRSEKAWAMTVLNDYKSRPAHMDQLHFDLWVGGVNALCDGGTYSYADDAGKRLVSNEAHNTAFVRGKSQMNSAGRFMILDRTARVAFEHSAGHFAGTALSRNGYRHERTVRLTDSGFELTDLVSADCELLFHTPCTVEQKDGVLRLFDGGRAVCELETSGELTTQQSMRSLYYLKADQTVCVRVKALAGNKTVTKINIL